MNKLTRISAMVVSCLAIGYFTKTLSQSALLNWYPNISLPNFSPGTWLWEPIWNMFYIILGISAGLVWDRIAFEKEAVTKSLKLFVAQLALLLLWFYLLLSLKNPMLAFLEGILLWLLIYETYLQFSKINKISAYLLLPYLLWIGYMSLVTAGIYWLNR